MRTKLTSCLQASWIALGVFLLLPVDAGRAGVETNATAATPTNAPAPPQPSPSAKGASESSSPFKVDDRLVGQVLRVNAKSRFVVLSFPVGRMPDLFSRMEIWRAGTNVGVVRISGPQRDETIVADLASGECAAGDEVREQPAPPPPRLPGKTPAKFKP